MWRTPSWARTGWALADGISGGAGAEVLLDRRVISLGTETPAAGLVPRVWSVIGDKSAWLWGFILQFGARGTNLGRRQSIWRAGN